MKNWLSLIPALLLFSCGGAEESSEEETKAILLEEPTEITSLYDESLKPFYHGVASGDPLSDAVIIWTRITPENHGEYAVKWVMANDEAMTDVVKEGEFTTNQERDYTVKVDVTGLEAGKTYYYQFEFEGTKSIVGRTKTTGNNGVEECNLAFASCSNYEWGFFNGYGIMAQDDELDAVIHLGDYIYEYAPGGYGDTTIGRIVYPPKEITELSDYRYRYSQYRTDQDLRAAHQMHPFITIWDDHESANSSYMTGAQNHTDSTEGTWDQRKDWAVQVYYEWMPIRDDANLYREFSFGDLASLFVLDTRFAGRTVQVDSMTDPHYMDEDRKIIDDAQFDALMANLKGGAKWKIVGNQVPFGPMINDWKNGVGRYLDGWDGYPVQREKLVTTIQEAAVENLVIVTGDYHSSFAFETDLNATKDASDNIGVEFVAPSINSANTNEYVPDDTTMMVESAYLKNNPHLKFTNLRDHGYVKLTITADEINAKFLYTESLRERSDKKIVGKEFVVKTGVPALIEKN
jgi:alkaline phosphatase D